MFKESLDFHKYCGQVFFHQTNSWYQNFQKMLPCRNLEGRCLLAFSVKAEHPYDIATEIHRQQSFINRPTIPTCLYQPDYYINCTCDVRQYPWHDLVGFTIEQRGQSTIPLHTYFSQKTYDLSIKHLSTRKVPGPDQIPNAILKQMPPKFHTLLFLFFTHCYKQKQIPASWKTSLTILLYKKEIPPLSPIIDQ
jgi:hypothetical protein